MIVGENHEGRAFDMTSRLFFKYWMPVIAWMAVIFAASGDMMSAEHTSRFIGPFLRWFAPDISPATIASVQFFVRKAAHLTEYAILGALLVRAVFFRAGKMTARYAVAIWLVAVAWAALDEFHQSFVASRTGAPADVMIDAIGALIGLGIYCWFARGNQAGARRREG